MREYLIKNDTETTKWDDYDFRLEDALIKTHMALQKKGLGDLREAQSIAQKNRRK